MDLSAHYAFDFLSGGGNGPWYTFNQICASQRGGRCEMSALPHHSLCLLPLRDCAAAFQALDAYGSAAGGAPFYLAPIAGYPSALAALDGLATFFLSVNGNASGLTDYGGNPANFLECVPTYIHAVPARAWEGRMSSTRV